MALAATSFPRFTLLSIHLETNKLVYYKNENEIVCAEGESVFNTLAKIEVEPAKIDNNLVHLRFCGTNRYWARDADGWIVAKSNQPEEDGSKSTCTLFRPTLPTESKLFNLVHVQTGGRVKLNDSGTRLLVSSPSADYDPAGFVYENWESLVKLPKHVAFKGDNGQYLKAVWAEGHTFLQFQTNDDPNSDRSGYQIQLLPDGHIRVKSDYTNKFWIRGNSWIWADSSDGGNSDKNTLFWPVKIDDNTIALRNEGNGKFCQRHSWDGFTNDLNAAVDTITNQAKIEVKELVLSRKIYNVTYQMEYARIYDVQPYVAGTTTAVNNGDQEASIAVEITYQDERSHSFSKGLSVTAGVSVTIEADVLGIEKGAVEFSFSVTGTFEWNDTTTTTKSITATGAVPVPAKSTAVVRYVGSKGTCDVPFSYTQTAISSVDGTTVQTEETDGIFKGVNCYDFSFEFDDVKRIGT